MHAAFRVGLSTASAKINSSDAVMPCCQALTAGDFNDVPNRVKHRFQSMDVFIGYQGASVSDLIPDRDIAAPLHELPIAVHGGRGIAIELGK